MEMIVTNGIRVDTPVLTTKGFKEEEMETVDEFIVEILEKPESDTVQGRVATTVAALWGEFSIYE
ncbi:hypothetical protein [Haloarcula amylovorans]|uniref:hypothetical protein n=1 Tax=Haloarcula amylovorans TaxID=2562280 RepID=UPI001076766F|nr:hypothetical protein [Halomicroarcula amylolytica]